MPKSLASSGVQIVFPVVISQSKIPILAASWVTFKRCWVFRSASSISLRSVMSVKMAATCPDIRCTRGDQPHIVRAKGHRLQRIRAARSPTPDGTDPGGEPHRKTHTQACPGVRLFFTPTRNSKAGFMSRKMQSTAAPLPSYTSSKMPRPRP